MEEREEGVRGKEGEGKKRRVGERGRGRREGKKGRRESKE